MKHKEIKKLNRKTFWRKVKIKVNILKKILIFLKGKELKEKAKNVKFYSFLIKDKL